MKKKAVFNWSGGKDSALALHKVLRSGQYELVSLLTTVNKDSKRSSMHAIPVSLLRAQADSIGIPLYLAEYGPADDIKGYESCMLEAVKHFKEQGVRHFIFGDICLHDVRSYREKRLKPLGMEVVEPLWDKSTGEIMDEFLRSGLKTVVVTTMANLLGKEYVGRLVDGSFVNDLPDGVDVCGENGEYHTFCFDGGVFRYPVGYSLGVPFKFSHTVNMDDGTSEVFSYWFANIDK